MKFRDIRVSDGMGFMDISEIKYRTYFYADGSVTFDSPIAINVSKSGGHRLILEDGKSVYVRPGWFAFEYQVANDTRLHWRF